MTVSFDALKSLSLPALPARSVNATSATNRPTPASAPRSTFGAFFTVSGFGSVFFAASGLSGWVSAAAPEPSRNGLGTFLGGCSWAPAARASAKTAARAASRMRVFREDGGGCGIYHAGRGCVSRPGFHHKGTKITQRAQKSEVRDQRLISDF